MISSILKYIAILVLSFILTGLMLVVWPIDWKKKIYIKLSYLWGASILFFCGIEVTTIGIENLKSLNKSIVVSNHASMFDIIAMFKVFPEIRFMHKKELTKIPIWGWALAIGPHIGVNREKGSDAMKSINKTIEKIKDGGHILLFAEGTRTLDGNMQPFKRGAFLLASKSGIPIVPLTISGTFGIKPKNTWKLNKSKVELFFHKPIYSIPTNKEEEIKLMNETHRIISEKYNGVLI